MNALIRISTFRNFDLFVFLECLNLQDPVCLSEVSLSLIGAAIAAGKIFSSEIIVNIGAEAVEQRMLLMLEKLHLSMSVSDCVSHD